MKKIISTLLILATGICTAAFSNPIAVKGNAAVPPAKAGLTSGSAWNLPAPGTIQFVKNTSASSFNILYTADVGSDAVVVRCPLNDTVMQSNSAYVCSLSPGETAKVQLTASSFSKGASGTFTLFY